MNPSLFPFRQSAALLLLSTALLFSACGNNSSSGKAFPSGAGTSEAAAEAVSEADLTGAAFLSRAEEAGSNVRYFSSDCLKGHSFTGLYAFGDNLLLAGFTSDYNYYFALYDPAEDRIIRDFSPEFGACDSYQVIGSWLFALDYDTGTIRIYDENLKSARTWDVSSIADDYSLTFLSTGDSNIYYCSGGSPSGISRIDLASSSLKKLKLNYYGASPQSLSPDGRHLLFWGIDRDSLKNEIAVLDTDTLQTTLSLQGTGFSSGDISNTGFLAEVNYMDDKWVYQAWDGDPLYFSLSGSDSAEAAFLDDDTFFVSRQTWTEDGSCFLQCIACDTDGERISAMQTDPAQLPFSSTFSSGHVYLPEYNCVLFLANEASYSDLEEDLWEAYSDTEEVPSLTPSDSCLLIWDLSSDPAEVASDITFTSDPAGVSGEETLSLIADRSSYDWGDLTECRQRADQMEAAYGIQIYLGPEIPDAIDCYHTEQMNDPEVISEALDRLEAIFSCYPANFLPQLCFGDVEALQFYLAGDLYGDADGMIDDPSAYVTNTAALLIMVLDLNQTWNWDYTINHELSHMIDRRLDYLSSLTDTCVYSEETWCSYNPSDFEYLYTYTGYESNADYEKYPDYFMDSYGTTFATEDRAELFGYALELYLSDFDYLDLYHSGKPAEDKMNYYCQCIRDGFDTSGWPDLLPWESVLE